jgi:hypothetical protein
MGMEPITLFARIADPSGAARLLRKLVPAVEIDGKDNNWRTAVVTIDARKLTFTHDPAYYSEPNWSVQMNGMRGYFSGFPNTDRKERALMLTTTFKFSLGTLFDPDYDLQGDPRLDVLFAVVEHLDGVLFTPSSFWDARGRILYGVGGENEEDPDAVWPRVAAEFSLSDARAAAAHEQSRPKPVEEDHDGADAPTPARVARRALALTAVTARAILEQNRTTIKPGAPRNPVIWIKRLFSTRESERQELVTWVRGIGIDDELDPDEWEVLQRPISRLEPCQQIDSTWRLEGLVVLAWALGRYEIPQHDELVKCDPLWQSLGLLDREAAKALLAHPTVRPRQDIATLRNRQFALHWRLRNYHLHPELIDFAEFARTAWFGPLDIASVPLVGGDLAIQGNRIDRASRDSFSTVHSAAQERHQAINWLWAGPTRYSEASVDT